MGWHNIRRDAADIAFSRYIRLRDGGRCKYPGCYYQGSGNDGITGLDNSHFHSRRNESVRFDPENCDAFCRNHHKYMGEHREEYIRFKQNQLGSIHYDLLCMRAGEYCKRDRKMRLIEVKLLLETL